MPTEDLNLGDKFTSENTDSGEEFIAHDFIVDNDGLTWVVALTVKENIPWIISEDLVDERVIYIQRVPNLKLKKKGKK